MEYSPGGGGGNVQLESSLGLPQGVVVDFDEATALKLTPGWKGVEMIERVTVQHLVAVGQPLEKITDFGDFLGATDLSDDRLEVTGIYQKIVQPMLATLPSGGADDKDLSALQKARNSKADDQCVDSSDTGRQDFVGTEGA